MLVTYIVCLGKTNKFLDSQRIVRVFVRMLLKRQSAVLLSDVAHSGVVRNVKDLEGVK